jgi:hypothetical protein
MPNAVIFAVSSYWNFATCATAVKIAKIVGSCGLPGGSCFGPGLEARRTILRAVPPVRFLQNLVSARPLVEHGVTPGLGGLADAKAEDEAASRLAHCGFTCGD